MTDNIPINKYYFTENALKLLKTQAKDTANKYGSQTIDIEHLVVAILHYHSKYLDQKLNISSINTLSIIEETISIKNNVVYKPVISTEVNDMLKIAHQEAQKKESYLISIDHILLAITSNPSYAVNLYLHRLGFSYDNLTIKLFAITLHEQNALKLYCTDLNDKALSGKMTPVIGRDNEIDRLLRILCRALKNNPVLVGEAGVGKTAVLEGVVLRIVNGQAPDSLKNKHFFSLDMSLLISGTKYRGEFEERLNQLLNAVRTNPNVILFIDELHTIAGTGGESGALDASNILKPALSRSEIQIIGATTLKEYKRYIEKDSALERRFQVVKVEEPSKAETLIMLEGIKEYLEKIHQIKYSSEALFEAVELSTRYLTDKHLPDKAIDLLDEAGALKRLEYYRLPSVLDSMENEFNSLERELENAMRNHKTNLVVKLQDRLEPLSKKITNLKQTINISNNYSLNEVSHHDIRAVISEMVGISIHNLDSSIEKQLHDIERNLKNQVIGQNGAIDILISTLRRSWIGLNNLERPLASFLFVGGTGVGKTFLAKRLAKNLFGHDNAFLHMDMNEYNEKQQISRLIGSAPGYVGYGEGGELTEKVRQNPYCVILFDEIEKAHKDIYNLLLRMLEDGSLQDSMGRLINFKHSIIILTSNLGSDSLVDKSVGFGDKINFKQEIANKEAYNNLKKTFPNQFLNRIDDIIYFNILSKENIARILEIESDMLCHRLVKDHSIYLKINEEVNGYLTEKAYSIEFGARNLRRIFNKELVESLALKMLKITKKPVDLEVELKNNSLVINEVNLDSSQH